MVTCNEKKKQKQRLGGGFELVLCLSRVERSTAVVIPCRLRERNFEKSSLAEFGCCTDIFA